MNRLMTQKVRKALPPLHSTEAQKEKVCSVKYFTPDSNWTWYAVEFDGDDTFFGYVEGVESEWGYFRLSELERVRGPMGLKVERDVYFSAMVIDATGNRRQIAEQTV